LFVVYHLSFTAKWTCLLSSENHVVKTQPKSEGQNVPLWCSMKMRYDLIFEVQDMLLGRQGLCEGQGLTGRPLYKSFRKISQRMTWSLQRIWWTWFRIGYWLSWIPDTKNHQKSPNSPRLSEWCVQAWNVKAKSAGIKYFFNNSGGYEGEETRKNCHDIT